MRIFHLKLSIFLPTCLILRTNLLCYQWTYLDKSSTRARFMNLSIGSGPKSHSTHAPNLSKLFRNFNLMILQYYAQEMYWFSIVPEGPLLQTVYPVLADTHYSNKVTMNICYMFTSENFSYLSYILNVAHMKVFIVKICFSH